ncbi:MAG: hypothetical protein HOP18_00615 [Deltaproteobacteria bacterium]|nr:hypothetical protein [Deltaproteobacteria bacterium]
MFNTVWAVIRDGKIEPLEHLELPEGAQVLVTLLSDDEEARFWQGAAQTSLDAIWDNAEDDVYAELLEMSVER